MSDMEVAFKISVFAGFLLGMALGYISIVVFHIIRVMLDKTT